MVVENYYKQKTFDIKPGKENQKLIGTLILRNVPYVLRYVKQSLTFNPVQEINVRKKLIDEAYQDGAYILEGKQLSNKVFLYNLTNVAMRKLHIPDLESLQTYLPSDFVPGTIGTRTQLALAAGLLEGKAYIIKQTSHYLGLGKVALFTADGLRAEFFLKQSSGLDRNLYIDPKSKVIGICRVYKNCQVIEETIVTSQSLGLDPRKYLPTKTWQSYWKEIVWQ